MDGNGHEVGVPIVLTDCGLDMVSRIARFERRDHQQALQAVNRIKNCTTAAAKDTKHI